LLKPAVQSKSTLGRSWLLSGGAADVTQPLLNCLQQYVFFPADQAFRQLKKDISQSKGVDVMMSIRIVGGAGEGRPTSGDGDGVAVLAAVPVPRPEERELLVPAMSPVSAESRSESLGAVMIV
jgi:hypothetical protein